MIQIALAILALAAGVHLLIQVKQASLGSLYRNLAWLVIVLSLGFMLCGIARGVMHMRHMRQCEASGQCDMKGGKGDCPYMQHSGCGMDAKGECGMKKDCCMEKKECCTGGEKKACCKDMKGGAAGCSEMGGEKAKPACCAKDSAGKK
jgi:hypothetical protein